MPFALILPLWVLCLVAGVVMLCLAPYRKAGIYVVTVSSGATLTALILSTVWLLLVGKMPQGPDNGIALLMIGIYLAIIPIGGLLGGFGAAFLTKHLLLAPPKSPPK